MMFYLIAMTLLLYGKFDETRAIENAPVAREIELSQTYSTTIANASHLLIILLHRTQLHINSTDEHFKSCIIAIDPVNPLLQIPIQAKSLASKVIVWSIRNKIKKDSTAKINYTILIIDPLRCNYETVATLEETLTPYWPDKNNHTKSVVGPDKCSYKLTSSAELLPHYWFNTSNHLPQVVVQDQDSFDVFYPSLTICAPCRYSVNDGRRIYLKSQIKPDTENLPLFSKIEAFDSVELRRGYFYANSFRNESAVIELLDRDFNVVKEKFFNHTVDVVAVSTGTPANISICYMTSRPFPYFSYIFSPNGKSANHIFCELFNNNFDPQFSTELILPDKVEPKAITLNIDSSSHLFVTVQSINLNQMDIFTLYRIDSSGALINSFSFGEIKNNGTRNVVRALLTDSQCCLEISQQSSNNTLPFNSGQIKCITI